MPPLDSSPAKWIWLPSQRTLACTFVRFRREFELEDAPAHARGWILADSRYLLHVNGSRVQWGPAAFDPRFPEADPVDLARFLRPGKNVIAVTVLFYGHGDGTWPVGKPGLLASFEIGGKRIVSDSTWTCAVDRGWRPGNGKRWYLRALQEEFDARLALRDWDHPDVSSKGWMPAMEIPNEASKASFAGSYADYANDTWFVGPETRVDERSIPLMVEDEAAPPRAVEQLSIAWRRPAEDWFDFRVPESFEIAERSAASLPWQVPAQATGQSHAITLDFGQSQVGWPWIEFDAPEGAILELITQESRDPAKPWLDSHFYTWSRVHAAGGRQRFETFDYEALRFLQVHVRNNSKPVTLCESGLRRRRYAWPVEAQIRLEDPSLQRLMDAALATLRNSAQDVVVDGMARERQQYSGDGAHQLHASMLVHGAREQWARFLKTFGQGQTTSGVWFDSWPAYDRYARIAQRQVAATSWGPLVDHSIGFCLDHWHYYRYTADLEPVRQNWPRLMRFVEYLESIRGEDGLLRVTNLGVEAVWIDHVAFRAQVDKQLALNLYAALALRSLSELAQALGEDPSGLQDFSGELQKACLLIYWDEESQNWVNNLPRLAADGERRMDDRSLATAILLGLSPRPQSVVDALAEPPQNLRLSYPANAVWRAWALARAGRGEVVLSELRSKWATLPSVIDGGTIQENWNVTPGSTDLYSHCAQMPLIALYHCLMGLEPLAPGFRELVLRPQVSGWPSFEIDAAIPQGRLHFSSKASPERIIKIQVPEGVSAFVELEGARTPIPSGEPFEIRAD